MIDLKEIFFDCVSCSDEYEWFEFKSNHVSPDDIGTYISALSNSAAMLGREDSYVFFGVDDKTHEIKGTTFNQNESVNGNEPLQHYLARQLSPSVAFYFEEMKIEGKRIVALVIPTAQTVPTGYQDIRYIRIGSSREKLSKYPQREAKLFSVLTFGMPSILTIESKRQQLTFNQLFGYYGSKGLKLRDVGRLRRILILGTKMENITSLPSFSPTIPKCRSGWRYSPARPRHRNFIPSVNSDISAFSILWMKFLDMETSSISFRPMRGIESSKGRKSGFSTWMPSVKQSSMPSFIING